MAGCTDYIYHIYMLEVNETTGNPTDFKSPRQMDAQCRKRGRFELETTWPHHKRELKGGFVLQPLDRKGLNGVSLLPIKVA